MFRHSGYWSRPELEGANTILPKGHFSCFAEFAAVLQNEAIQESGGAKVKVLCGTPGVRDIGL